MNHAALDRQVNQTDHVSGVEAHAPLVKRIAYHLMARMPACVQVDDLIQSGMIGLLEASRSFDDTKGASFETFAGIRIRGAMLDEMRRGDWVPRSVHRNSRQVLAAIARLEKRVERPPRDVEIANEMEISLEEYYAIAKDIDSSKLGGYEDCGVHDDAMSDALAVKLSVPHEAVEKEKLKAVLVETINTLPERERLVLNLYYDEDMNLKEIGEVLGVTESRVSQIHSQALGRLKVRIKDWQL